MLEGRKGYERARIAKREFVAEYRPEFEKLGLGLYVSVVSHEFGRYLIFVEPNVRSDTTEDDIRRAVTLIPRTYKGLTVTVGQPIIGKNKSPRWLGRRF